MELIIYKKTQKNREPITTTILLFKTKTNSNFEFYLKGLHKANPRILKRLLRKVAIFS